MCGIGVNSQHVAQAGTWHGGLARHSPTRDGQALLRLWVTTSRWEMLFSQTGWKARCALAACKDLPGCRPNSDSERDSVQMQDNLPADDLTRPSQPVKLQAALLIRAQGPSFLSSNIPIMRRDSLAPQWLLGGAYMTSKINFTGPETPGTPVPGDAWAWRWTVPGPSSARSARTQLRPNHHTCHTSSVSFLSATAQGASA